MKKIKISNHDVERLLNEIHEKDGEQSSFFSSFMVQLIQGDNMKRNLDDQAKIFSLSFNKKDTSIFRLTTTFKNKIDEKSELTPTQKILKIANNTYSSNFSTFIFNLFYICF